MRLVKATTAFLTLAFLSPAASAAVNLAQNKTATASNSSASFQPWMAVDGTTTTKWVASTTGSQWLRVNLGSSQSVRRWVVKHAATTGDDQSLNGMTYELQAYVYGGGDFSWATVDRVSDNSRDLTDRDIPARTAQYWRVRITGPGADQIARIAEFGLYADPRNSAYRGAVWASSSLPNEGPELAVDGSTSSVIDGSSTYVGNSKWCTNTPGDNWLIVDLGNNQYVQQWAVHHAGAGGEDSDWNTRDFSLLLSEDGSNWLEVDAVRGNRANMTNRILANPIYARYAALYITDPGPDDWTRIYEFQVFPLDYDESTTPATWQEVGWPYHDKLLTKVAEDNDVAVYYDSQMDAASANWTLDFARRMWDYTRKTYGAFGRDNRLWVRAHANDYATVGRGGMYHDYGLYHNFVDIAMGGEWNGSHTLLMDFFTHEAGHIVEWAGNGMDQCLGDELWGDSAFNGIFQYDAYFGMGERDQARRFIDQMGDQMVLDWFYPMWRDYGHSQPLVRYHQLIARYFPKSRNFYAREINHGEFVHFWSAAARANLAPLARQAFPSWPSSWESELATARVDFPDLNYAYSARTEVLSNLNPTPAIPGQPIYFDWSADAQHSSLDWVGLYEEGTGDGAYLQWQYVGSPGATWGSLAFTVPEGAPRTYELRYFLNDGWERSATASFIAEPASNLIGVWPEPVRRNTPVSVSWSAPAGHSDLDWVGLYRSSDDDYTMVGWQYVGSGGATEGTLTFTAPDGLGVHEFRYFPNDGWDKTATLSFSVM